MNKNELSRGVDEYIGKTLERLGGEISLLQEWFRKDYPESRLDVKLNMDIVKKKLDIALEVLTGKELANNQKKFQFQMQVQEKQFLDPILMSKFLKGFNEHCRKGIANAINLHYAQEQADKGLLT
jgi:hypothetical protein